jgi:hypothetical protein
MATSLLQFEQKDQIKRLHQQTLHFQWNFWSSTSLNWPHTYTHSWEMRNHHPSKKIVQRTGKKKQKNLTLFPCLDLRHLQPRYLQGDMKSIFNSNGNKYMLRSLHVASFTRPVSCLSQWSLISIPQYHLRVPFGSPIYISGMPKVMRT